MRPRLVTDEAIDTAARQVFLQHGPGASVALVAERLGVSSAALFHRVGSKERLLVRALSPRSPTVLTDLAHGPVPAPTVEEQLVGLLGEVLAYFRESIPGLVVLRAAGIDFTPGLPPGDPPPVALRRALAQWLQRVSSEPLSPPDADALAECLIGAAEARCFNAHVGGTGFVAGSDPAFLRALVRASWSGEGRPGSKGGKPKRP